jgi:amino acid adenylation domain-containing protein
MSRDVQVAEPERARSVHQAFEAQVRRSPSALAVRCGAEELSYAELDARASRLARYLRQRGLHVGDLVAVSMGRTPDLLVAMLAVLKAGGAYVPVEPTAPEPLIRHVLAAAKPFAVLTREDHRIRLANAFECPVVCLDTEAAQIGAHPDEPLAPAAGPDDLACVFFTSGSTGRPKGAMNEHRNLLSAFEGLREVFQFTPADRHLQSTTFEFDVFTADWVRALCSGGALVMAQRNFTLDWTADIAELHDLILAERITVMETNVATIRRLHAYLRPLGRKLGVLRLLTVGADKWYLDEQVELQEYLGEKVRVVNTYGVAEASVDSTYFEVGRLPVKASLPARISLIGKPLPGTRLSIVDPATGSPVAAGVPGEIRIGGPGVGRGYLGDRRLTAVRFPVMSFGSEILPGYRTGDIGLVREDGIVEYIGREEAAVNPAGVLELARLEGLIREHPQVGECLVVDIETPAGGWLRVAYVVAADPSAPLDTEVVRSAAAGLLPASALPAAIMPLPSLPRTRAGKLDRAHLPLPTGRDGFDADRDAGRARSLKGGMPAGRSGVPAGCLWAVACVFLPGAILALWLIIAL